MGSESDREAILRSATVFSDHMAAHYTYVARRPVGLHVLSDALVTATAYPDPDHLVGAVYDGERRIVRSSQRLDPQWIQPADPELAPEAALEGAERVPSALYGGMLFLILGHFLFESAARLWPRIDFPAGSVRTSLPVIYHPCPGFDLDVFLAMPFLRQAFAALGVHRENLILADRDLLVDRLYYPDTISIYHEYVHPMMSELLDHLADRIVAARPAAGAPATIRGGRRIFLSRAKWRLHVRIANEAELADAFRAHGFEVVHPQEMQPAEIIELMRAAECVASSDGSHAHLVAFARPGTRCLHLDTRPVPTQSAIEKLRGLRSFHLPIFENPADIWNETTKRIDVGRIEFVIERFAAGTLDAIGPSA